MNILQCQPSGQSVFRDPQFTQLEPEVWFLTVVLRNSQALYHYHPLSLQVALVGYTHFILQGRKGEECHTPPGILC